MLRLNRVLGAIALLLPIFAYNNCGQPGFVVLDEATLLASSDIDPNATDNSKYLLTCVTPTNLSAKLSSNEEQSSRTEFSGKWAEDLRTNDTRTAVVRGKLQASANNETLLVQINNECVQTGGAQSTVTRHLSDRGLNQFLKVSSYKINAADYSASELSDAINNDLCIQSIDKNATFQLMAATNDPRTAEQKHLSDMRFDSAFPRIYNAYNGINREVRVAVLDSGVDVQHPDLSANILRTSDGRPVSYNALNNSTDVTDSGYHGTHVAGLIAAVSNNSWGVSGVMGAKAKIIPVKVSADGATVDLDAVINGIKWATDQGAHVINMSFTSNRETDDRPALREAIEYALRKGVLFVVAAGNSSTQITASNHFYPAKYSALYAGFITVGSYDAGNSATRSGFSNYGSAFVKIMAPGQNGSDGILSTVPTSWTATGLSSKNNGNPIQGTSMASPMVAGAAAVAIGLAKSRGYFAPPEQIEKILLQGSQKIASLASYAKDGNKLDLLNLVEQIDIDTNLNSNSSTDRSSARGTLYISSHSPNQQALYGSKIELAINVSSNSSTLINYTWIRNGVTLPNQTGNKLTISAAQRKDAGVYDVKIQAGSSIQTRQIYVALASAICPKK
ncbi:MAG: S8 family serine peptidase [Bdellovibrio sp.]|nr:S8 family serine peptidase [Bdellovibrio sp.]